MPGAVRLKSYIEIEGRKIGQGRPVFVIAEIGVNHDGKLAVARKMIDHAAKCGVDCIKFQTFRADEFLADRTMTYEYEVKGKKVSENMFEMFKRLELPIGWYAELFHYARKRGLIPLTSVADEQSADMAEDLGVKAFKLSSEDLINLPLVEYVVRKWKPIIFSTGMADETEMDDVLGILRKHRFTKAIFLHCVSLYPTLPEEAHLKRILYLAQKVKAPVGYSDHTVGIEACSGAVALGACVIEKHFTLNKERIGPDHFFSAEPGEMKRLVEAVRKIGKMLGDATMDQSAREVEVRKKFRRSIVAASDLSAGHVVAREDLVLKRPGNGLRGREIPRLIGWRLKKSVKKDRRIYFSMLEL
jgi:N,N'-diacetyllegionaminate synthase